MCRYSVVTTSLWFSLSITMWPQWGHTKYPTQLGRLQIWFPVNKLCSVTKESRSCKAKIILQKLCAVDICHDVLYQRILKKLLLNFNLQLTTEVQSQCLTIVIAWVHQLWLAKVITNHLMGNSKNLLLQNQEREA